MELSRILVPTDFSPHAAEALKYAAELARLAGAELHILNVHQTPIYAFMDAAYTPSPKVISGELDLATDRTRGLATEVQSDELEVVATVREGVIHDSINSYAREKNVDLIVMGTHGRTGLNRVIWGSVVERVLKTTLVPLITVPLSGGGRSPFNVLIAHDFSEPAVRAANVARCIHGLTRGPVHVAHSFIDVWAEYTDRGGLAGDAALKRREALRRGLHELLAEEIEKTFSIDHEIVQSHLMSGDPTENLIKLAEELDVDLICAGATGKSGFERMLLGSVAQRLLQQSKVPVLFAH